jgi:putative cell wall-binding protein
VPTEAPDTLRVAGAGRVATAVEVSRATRDSAATVVLARADEYADALAAAPLAVHVDAPLLLSASRGLSDATAAEVARLGANAAILLGGEAALSEQVVTDLEDMGLTVRRIAGENRFGTAAKVPAELPPTDEVLVAEGEHVSPERGWPDALSASGLAAAERRPVLLVNRDRLPRETAQALDASTAVVIVGGSDAISQDVADAIDQVAGTVTRVFGVTRYDTSVAVADEAEARGVDPSTVWVATGRDWPDGLVAGVAAGAADGILLLVDGQDLDGSPASAQWLRDHAEVVSTVRLSGGEQAISPETESRIRQELGGA